MPSPIRPALILSPRRRHSLTPFLPPTYVLPPPVAVSLFAILSVSLTLALRTLQPSISPLQPFVGFSQRLRNHLKKLLPQPPPPQKPHFNPPAIASRLDSVRDRAIANLEATRLSTDPALSDDEYSTLHPLQRRDLLAKALLTARQNPNRTPTRTSSLPSAGNTVKNEGGDGKEENGKEWRGRGFWKGVECLNGRAAALGFVVCLAREAAEPGHPGLFEQVVDVVVPIAQKTPPFLVAFCDRVVDLLT